VSKTAIPKGLSGEAKAKGSKAFVVIPDVLQPIMEMWRQQNAGAGPDALIFPGETGLLYGLRIVAASSSPSPEN